MSQKTYSLPEVSSHIGVTCEEILYHVEELGALGLNTPNGTGEDMRLTEHQSAQLRFYFRSEPLNGNQPKVCSECYCDMNEDDRMLGMKICCECFKRRYQ